MTDAPVALGEMRLYDAVRPPLTNATYRLQVDTTLDRPEFDLPGRTAFFAIEGPRFSLAPSEVAAVHPPRNAQGTFHEVLPHIVLGRRTLPWERELDAHGLIPEAPPGIDDIPVRSLDGAAPWLALLVFRDDPDAAEATMVGQVPLSTVVTDAAIRGRMDVEGDPLVDAVDVDAGLLRRILPTKDELRLLCHARQVNVADRELAAGDSDGWFAVVMANRLPAGGHRHRACLVSLEERTDLVSATPPQQGATAPAPGGRARLVLLHSWSFTADEPRPGGGSFSELAEALDVGLMGAGAPQVADTGHLPISLLDRAGTEQTVWYRGPLCPRPVARDALGPYHSADQARRVSPETGAEDVTYAAAFELGRLLAAADGRLAQDLMRWRREAYRGAARSSVASAVWTDVPDIVMGAQEALQQGMAAPVAVTVLERAGSGAGAPADTTGIEAVRAAPGLDPVAVARAWRVTTDEARALLSGTAEPDAALEAPQRAAEEPSGSLRDARERLRRAAARRDDGAGS